MRTGRACYLLAPGILALLLVSGCRSLPNPAPQLDSLGRLEPDNIIVMGKVQLLPPLFASEQKFSVNGRYPEHIYRNGVIFLYDSRMRDIKKPRRTDYARHIVAPLGEYFFVQLPRSQKYLIFSELPMETGDLHWPSKFLPAGFEIPSGANDRAVYIGTLNYYRNKFFDITKVELVDDFRLAEIEFVERFGRGIKLKKALLRDTRKDTSGASGI